MARAPQRRSSDPAQKMSRSLGAFHAAQQTDRIANDNGNRGDGERLEDSLPTEEFSEPVLETVPQSYTQAEPEDEGADFTPSDLEERQKMRSKEAGMRKAAGTLSGPKTESKEQGATGGQPTDQSPEALDRRRAAQFQSARYTDALVNLESEQQAAQAATVVAAASAEQPQQDNFFDLAKKFFGDVINFTQGIVTLGTGLPEALIVMNIRLLRGLFSKNKKKSKLEQMPGMANFVGVARHPIEKGWILACDCLTCMGCLVAIALPIVLIMTAMKLI